MKCTAIFVDLRDSSSLPNKYKRPTLAKIYRSYISEVVAIMNGNSHCEEIRIDGDCISGIYDTPYKKDIDDVFHDCYATNSIIKTLNCKYKKRNIDPIKAGIGIDYGRALMIKAGYSGSGLNEVVWMGDVVNQASKLCSNANKGYEAKPIFSSTTIYNKLGERNQNLLEYNYAHECYHGNIIRNDMEE